MSPRNEIELVSLVNHKFDGPLLRVIPKRFVDKFQIVPFKLTKDVVTIATTEPNNIDMRDFLEQELNLKVKLVEADVHELKRTILTQYGESSSLSELVDQAAVDSDDIKDQEKRIFKVTQDSSKKEGDQSVLDVFRFILDEAILNQASDLHIEPTRDCTYVRSRIDGVLHEVHKMPLVLHKGIVSIIKVNAAMNITETRIPQDGQMSAEWNGQMFDMRIATVPTLYGEKVVIRILTKETLGLGLEKLGFSERTLTMLRKVIRLPSGLILVTGPTGSGKTTTLFSVLTEIRDVSKNILTIEDPIEYRLDLINQIEVQQKKGLDFSAATRSLLRLDPDVVLVGEIRDKETAQIAVQSSLAGTLLLSTIHSNNAIGTIDRVINLGVDNVWVGSALSAIVAQRLVRRICKYCVTPYKPDEETLNLLELPKDREYVHGRGCDACLDSGYSGRLCISEMLIINDPIRNLIFDKAAPSEILETAMKEGFVSFLDEAKEKIMENITTPEEILRKVPLRLR